MSHIKLEPCTAYWEMHQLQEATPPLLDPGWMNFEPEAIAEPGFNRRREVLPHVSFCKLGVPSDLGTAWGYHTCAMVAWLGGHLT